MKTCWAQYLLWLVIVIMGTMAMLSGCGQRGPLFLPDKESVAAKKAEKQKKKKEKATATDKQIDSENTTNE